MYELQGVGRKDSMAKMQAMARNWTFFDAPVAIVVTVDRVSYLRAVCGIDVRVVGFM